MIKALLLDWGGVISPAGTPDEVPSALAKIVGVPLDEAKQLIKAQSSKLKRGQITDDEFWQGIEQETGTNIAEEKRDIWTPTEMFRPDEDIINMVGQLQSNGFTVGVLSNVFPSTAAGIKEQGWYDSFDPVVISTDAGFAKPDTEFYQLAIEKCGCKPEEILFLDDQQYCIDGAKENGINAVLVSSPAKVIEVVKTHIRF